MIEFMQAKAGMADALVLALIVIGGLALWLYAAFKNIKSLRERRDYLAAQVIKTESMLEMCRSKWLARFNERVDNDNARVRAILGQVYRLQKRLVDSQAVIDALLPLANQAAQTTGEVIRVGFEVRLMAERGLKDHKIIPPQALREILALEAPIEAMSGDMRKQIDEFNDRYVEHMKSGGAYARILTGRLERQEQSGGRIMEEVKSKIGSGEVSVVRGAAR
jgi:hypothetical protein